MTYNITNWDGTPLVSVANSTIDSTTTSISLFGRNAVNFGLPLNENFIALLEHFAGTSEPPNPVKGQIWFDTRTINVKIYDGTQWLIINPPFDGTAGTATVAITASIDVVVYVSDSNVVSVISHGFVPPSELPPTIAISNKNFAFSSRFPNGLYPGITLASDPNNYQFNGVAWKANALTTSRNIGLSGSISGNVQFDGSNDVVITSNLINVLNANISSGWFSNLYVNSNGTVSDATYIDANDVWTALAYTPPSDVRITGDASGNTSANGTVFTVNVTLTPTTVVPGNYTNVTVDSSGRVISGNNETPLPFKSIILWEDILVPNGWAKCDGSVVPTPYGSVTTPNLTGSNIGPTFFIIKVI
jgi:hypothetical protein